MYRIKVHHFLNELMQTPESIPSESVPKSRKKRGPPETYKAQSIKVEEDTRLYQILISIMHWRLFIFFWYHNNIFPTCFFWNATLETISSTISVYPLHVGLTQNVTCFKGSQVKDPISSWDVSWKFCVGFLRGKTWKQPVDVGQWGEVFDGEVLGMMRM